jgi:ADP-ribosyl-[dinitrogen reductase] hydrolase
MKKQTRQNYILGAIVGDVIGSVYEWNNVKSLDFPLFKSETTFTDDSVLTIASMKAILYSEHYTKTYQEFGRNYPNRGYGDRFIWWLMESIPKPYNSWGNGSAMRVSPIGWFFDTIEDVLEQAKKSAEVSHNHPEGIKGAQAVAAAVYLARNGKSKSEIKEYITHNFSYDLDRTIDEIRPIYEFDVSCQGSVPEAIIAFLESTDFENAIRLAISIGGDSDTIACITGALAEAYYKEIPNDIIEKVWELLPDEFANIVEEFTLRFEN